MLKLILKTFVRAIKYTRRRYFPTPKEKVLKRFDDENGRIKTLEHPDLNDSSLILDIGGYLGDFTTEVFARYNCLIKVFEPIPTFADVMKKRFAKNNKIEVLSIGLGNQNKVEKIILDGDASTLHKKKKNKEETSVEIVDVVDWFNENNIQSVSLMSINIEGGEFPLLNRLIESGYIEKIKNIQVQFHDIYQEDAEEQMIKIQNELTKTHELTYQYKFVWENWKLKK